MLSDLTELPHGANPSGRIRHDVAMQAASAWVAPSLRRPSWQNDEGRSRAEPGWTTRGFVRPIFDRRRNLRTTHDCVDAPMLARGTIMPEADPGEVDHHPRDGGDAYLTQRQVCERYRVSARTALRRRVTGHGPPLCWPRAAYSAAGAICLRFQWPKHLTFRRSPSAGVCVDPRRSASKSIQVTRHCSVKRRPARVGCVGFPPFYSSFHTWRLEPPEAQSTGCLLVPFLKRKEADAADARGRRACGRRISELPMRSTRTDARRRESKRLHSIQAGDSARFSRFLNESF